MNEPAPVRPPQQANDTDPVVDELQRLLDAFRAGTDPAPHLSDDELIAAIRDAAAQPADSPDSA